MSWNNATELICEAATFEQDETVMMEINKFELLKEM